MSTGFAAFQRVAIVGSSGSGKTTLARALAARLGCPHVELDALNWEPGWTAAPLDIFRQRVAAAVAEDAWVSDGNYGSSRDLVWPRAQAIVWLDYSLAVCFRRVFLRTMRRLFTRQGLWSGNKESFRMAFLSRDSLLLWVLRTHNRRRRDIRADLEHPEHAHLTVVRHGSPGETRQWRRDLEAL